MAAVFSLFGGCWPTHHTRPQKPKRCGITCGSDRGIERWDNQKDKKRDWLGTHYEYILVSGIDGSLPRRVLSQPLPNKCRPYFFHGLVHHLRRRCISAVERKFHFRCFQLCSWEFHSALHACNLCGVVKAPLFKSMEGVADQPRRNRLVRQIERGQVLSPFLGTTAPYEPFQNVLGGSLPQQPRHG